MPSILPDFEYDIFVSYRQKDNKVDGWVTSFVAALKAELEATLKNPVSIYFDENPHDGLLETHQVNATLDTKLRCVVFMPIVSQTYCDPGSYAWQGEFLRFLEMAKGDRLGPHVVLSNGNVVSRVLPIQIHELDADDQRTIEAALGGPMRAIPFIYTAPGVNRPLRPQEDHPENNKNRTVYRDQINKVANALKDIGSAVLRKPNGSSGASGSSKPVNGEPRKSSSPWLKVNLLAAAVLILTVAAYYVFNLNSPALDASKASIAVIPFRNNTGDPGMSHYGVGIASEVSTKLGLTRQFDFISSLQATIQYQQSEKSPAEIGKELGVTHILTGIYQTAGDNMQVTVELMDASGKVIWSLPYKTRYTDIFEVQRNIAARVKDKFDIQGVEERPLKTPNLEAYAHFIKGIEMVLKSNRPEDRMKAVAEYQQAIEIDSSFIEPWGGIIEEYCYYYWNRGATSELTLEMIEPYMDYVQRSFPNDWKKKAVIATYEYWALAHYQKALDLFLEVIEEAPQDPGVRSMVAAIYRRQLKLNEAYEQLKVSLKQSPAAVIYWVELVAIAQINGDYETAIQSASTIYELNEALSGNLYRLRQWTGSLEELPEPVKRKNRRAYEADLLLQQRNFPELLKLMETAPDSVYNPPRRLYYQIIGNYLLSRDDQVKKLGAAYLALDDNNITRRLDVLAMLGQEEEFRRLLEQPGRSLEEDLSLQCSVDGDILSYLILSGNYEEATLALKEINREFPQVGDYGWLNLPIYDRIKSEHPPFSEALKGLKLPPHFINRQLAGL
jgi:TolB-like protein